MARTEKIANTIDELIGQLADADSREAARIRSRIAELENLKKDNATT